jgi:cytochrome P450
MATCPFSTTLERMAVSAEAAISASATFALMPVGQACDMGHAPDGAPLIDPRIFDSVEFMRNPYPYYRIMRDHYPVFRDKLHNCYYVTRYQDVTDCYLTRSQKARRAAFWATPSSN